MPIPTSAPDRLGAELVSRRPARLNTATEMRRLSREFARAAEEFVAIKTQLAALKAQIAQHDELLAAFMSAALKLRRCTRCGELRPLDCFSARPSRQSPARLHRICKDCQNETRRNRYPNPPPRVEFRLPEDNEC